MEWLDDEWWPLMGGIGRMEIVRNRTMEERILRMKRDLELPEYRHIPWVKDFTCPECGRNEWGYDGWRARPIGWCNTDAGYMCIFECPECYAKMRWHISGSGRWSEERFFADLWLSLMMGNEELLCGPSEIGRTFS